VEMGSLPSANGRPDRLVRGAFPTSLWNRLIDQGGPMSNTGQRRTPSSNPDRLPIFSSVGQRRRNLSGIAILVLTAVALIALAFVLVSAVQ
jgi:hypothetical protein